MDKLKKLANKLYLYMKGNDHLEGFHLMIFLMASILYMEIILRINTKSAFFSDGLIFITLSAGAAALLVFLLTSLFKGVGRRRVVGIFLVGLTLIFSSQLIYYKIFKTFYTLFSAAKAGQAVEFANVALTVGQKNLVWLLLLLLPLGIFFVLQKAGAGNYLKITRREQGIAAGLMAGFFAAALLLINLGDKGNNSAYAMYYQSTYPEASVARLGMLTNLRLDLQRTIFGFKPRLEALPDGSGGLTAPYDKVSTGPQIGLPGNGAGNGTGDLAGIDVVAQAAGLFGDNVMAIDFGKLLAETEDETLKNMHMYFAGRPATQKNEYTGKFAGYNLIFLTAEGYSHYAVDQTLTPTLYKMTHEGFNFTDFYNPIWGVSTSDGEYVATTGLIPKEGVWSLFHSGTNAMPFAMGNQLRQIGYKTTAYHNHTFDYYDRNISHPNLGYDYKGLGNGLVVRETWPESDIEMVDVTTPEFINDQPFHTYYMTVSGHMFYNFDENFIAYKNQDLVKNLPYTENGKAYLATQIELDRALELLLQRLEEAGVAEKTLIVMSADHYPYGLEKNEIDDLAGHVVEENFELYKSSLIIYAKGMQPEVVSRPVSSLDIIPTISNLMGLEFDSRLLMGVDIFSTSPPRVIFENRSFITEIGRYNSETESFTPNPGAVVPEGYVEAIRAEVAGKFSASALILENDYYRKVINR